MLGNFNWRQSLTKLDPGNISITLLSEAYRKSKNYQKSLSVANDLSDNDWRKHLITAYCYMHTNDTERSFSCFEKARELISKDSDSYMYDSRIRINAGYVFLLKNNIINKKGVYFKNLIERVKEAEIFLSNVDIKNVGILQKKDLEDSLKILKEFKGEII